MKKISIFSIPKPSNEKVRTSNRNAITSWRRIQPPCEVLLFGGDADATALALEMGISHEPEVACTEYGTPLLSDVFGKAQQTASGDMLMYSNSDMIYFDDLHKAVAAVPFEKYMLCGRRWDFDVSAEIPSGDSAAWQELKKRATSNGRLHSSAGLDFFIFPKSLRIDMPSFVVGRPGWDSWFMWYLRSNRIPVIDGTDAITAVHQNHDYSYLKQGAAQYNGPERKMNYKLAGGYMNMLGLREADWVFCKGRVVRPSWPRRLFGLMGPTFPYRLALAAKRHSQRLVSSSG